MSVGLCLLRGKVCMCVWETLAELKCLLLMGLTFPSASQSVCFCYYKEFFFAVLTLLSCVLFTHTHSHFLLLTIPAPLRLELHPINAI